MKQIIIDSDGWIYLKDGDKETGMGDIGVDTEIIDNRKDKKRTNRQNAALHLYFTLLAEALNESGADMRATIRQDVDIPWSPENIKEYLWRPIQEAFFKKKSTTKLTTKEIDKIYDVLNKTIGERTSVHVPFPSIDNLIVEEYASQKPHSKLL